MSAKASSKAASRETSTEFTMDLDLVPGEEVGIFVDSDDEDLEEDDPQRTPTKPKASKRTVEDDDDEANPTSELVAKKRTKKNDKEDEKEERPIKPLPKGKTKEGKKKHKQLE